jgi:diaminohydroxyphosphoribosylaminopyrimidine deaminase / 5-amino-6-(5-phosphoribosylamino)uracil reductase
MSLLFISQKNRIPHKFPSRLESKSKRKFCGMTAPLLSKNHIFQAMQTAAAEARKWLGATSPNPPVGAAALDANGTILAVAAHQKAGTAHAEAALLTLCREQNLLDRVHTMCVTLEPCNHHGRTPPCSEAIIAAGIKHVVIGARDPNPHVRGGGIQRLQDAGIEVITGVAEEDCQQLIHAFAYHAQTGNSWVTVKRAFDLNGSMIPPQGQKTFTSPESLTLAHRLRKKLDAILTGSGTILADNPMFSVRHVPDHENKTRILAILDRRGRVPRTYLKSARERGLNPVIYHNLDSAFANLTQRGVQDILVEAGPAVSDAVLNSPHWTMKVDIHKGDPDKIDVAFNPDIAIPFLLKNFHLEFMLPSCS